MTTLFTKTHLAFFAFASLLASANIALAYDEDYPMFSAYPGADIAMNMAFATLLH